LFIRALGSDRFPIPGTIPEKVDLNIWKVTELTSNITCRKCVSSHCVPYS
jgi:hypothetical protein